MKDAERRRLARRARSGERAEPAGSAPPGFAVVWCDGGSRGNPGPAAYAYVIDDADGREVAEGLAAAARLGLDRVEVRTDSRLVVRHLVAERPLRNPGLKALRDRARATADDLAGVTYRWVPADQNARADALVAALLD
jgi:probable phosphoglycerate mutase